MNINYSKEFELFAKGGGIKVDGITIGNYLNGFESSLTPYILEERQMNVTQMDVFSRLMKDRILWCSGQVDSRMSDIIQAQLLFLDSVGSDDITMYINSPGGSVLAGLSMVDTMDTIKSDVATSNLGMCASMGSVLLGAGAKGKRSSLRFSRVMIHQSSGGFQGNIQDATIQFEEWKKYNDLLFTLLGEYTGKDPKQVESDASRDKWLSSQEALEYGIIDEIVQTRKQRSIKISDN